MTPLERVLCTLGHRAPDRVPVFLLPTMHGARHQGVPLPDFLQRPDLMARAQVRLQAELGHDCYYGLTYAAAEAEAFGGRTQFFDDGPPNAGAPVLDHRDGILALRPPDPREVPALRRARELVQRLAEAAVGRIPVLGVVMAPAALAVMLLGFERLLVLLHEDEAAVDHLLRVTTRFALDWGRAQLDAGATAITVFDPLSAADVTAPDLFARHVRPTTAAVVAGLGGPVALHLASGRLGPRLDALVGTGAVALGVGAGEDLAAVKRAAAGRIALVGNLNGLAMCRWDEVQARRATWAALDAAAGGGGFILADHHGEIPFPVELSTLHAIMEAARTWRAGEEGAA